MAGNKVINKVIIESVKIRGKYKDYLTVKDDKGYTVVVVYLTPAKIKKLANKLNKLLF